MSHKGELPPLPRDFIWGVSASGYQSEGGSLDSNWDRYNAANPSQDRYGTSVDFRHRYKDDIDLAKELGVNTFRIGINWARVEREKGVFDEAELAYYDDVIRSMKAVGLAPLITLDHFVYPGWIADQGGWENPETVTAFVGFSRLIAERYIQDVDLWLTFNEAAFFMLIEFHYRKLKWAGLLAMRRHVAEAHNQVYDLIHALKSSVTVTSNIVWCGDGWRSKLLQAFTDWLFLNRTRHKMDCLAFDYYYKDIDDSLLQGRPWESKLEPAGLGRALKALARRNPSLPLLVAENGMPTLDNQPRQDGARREMILRDCVYWVQRSRAEGIPVVGYMYWSLTDNFEWGTYTARFGLFTVDVMTDRELVRKPTAAVAEFKDIIRAGGVEPGYMPS